MHLLDAQSASGILELKHARVRWFLSVDSTTLPKEALEQNKRTFRLISINGESVEFSEGFTDLHAQSYCDILKGGGFGLQDAKPSIQIVHQIRNTEPLGLVGDYHPFCKTISK